MNYRCRNDYCLVRMVAVGQSRGGIALPDGAASSQTWFVEATGPDIKDLKAGDEVMIIGTVGEDLARLPREKDLFILKQANILLVVEKEASE